MKVTKGPAKPETRKIIAFYRHCEIVFRDNNSDKNFVLNSKNTVHAGAIEFDRYLKMCQSDPSFIPFYEGDTINIEL